MSQAIEPMKIGRRLVGPGNPVYVIAEMSANHNHDFDEAIRIIKAARDAGADAIKIQTYTPDTMTIDCDLDPFVIKGTIWDRRTLYELYGEAHTPWDWQPKLLDAATEMGIDLFSTPFDSTAVDFLEKMDIAIYKIASFENADIPLLRRVGATKKPVIMSTGMATVEAIAEAVETLRTAGCPNVALLKCTSAYPASPEEVHLKTIPDLQRRFGTIVGLSDHTLGIVVPVAAVSLGISIIEKHFTLSRRVPGPDAAFSLEPDELKAMVASVRTAEKALGGVQYGAQKAERKSRVFRRSLFVVEDVKVGSTFNEKNVRVIRPGTGLHPRYYDYVLGRKAAAAAIRGTPMTWGLVASLDGRPERFAVAAIKRWNREVFQSSIAKLPGEWRLIDDPRGLTIAALEKFDPRFVFFLHWSDKVPVDVLERFECVCFHMTDVPYGRGGSPLQNLIERGHHETRMTALRMTEGFDEGPVYLKECLSLAGTAQEIYVRASRTAARMIARILQERPEPVVQHGHPTVFKRRSSGQSLIPSKNSLAELYDFIRMLDAETYPKAFLDHEGFRYEFTNAIGRSEYIEACVRIRPANPKEKST